MEFSEKTIDVTMEMWEYIDGCLGDPENHGLLGLAEKMPQDAVYVARRLMRQAVGTRLVDDRDG